MPITFYYPEHWAAVLATVGPRPSERPGLGLR